MEEPDEVTEYYRSDASDDSSQSAQQRKHQQTKRSLPSKRALFHFAILKVLSEVVQPPRAQHYATQYPSPLRLHLGKQNDVADGVLVGE
jgi:hypothetical protein